jgi:uncharacterized membrane protein YGL010W
VTKNIGKLDRVIRLAVVLAIAIAYFTGKISGNLAIVLSVAATVFFLTSLIGTCPAYLPFGLSTRGKK